MHNFLRLTLICTLFQLFFASSVYAQTAAFSVSDSTGCAPLTVYFTDHSTGSVSGWHWNLGNSNTPTTQNPSTTYSNPGTYTVSLYVSGAGGNSAVVTKTIVVYDIPTGTISASPTAGCTPLSVSFSSNITANSPGTPNIAWDFGDGNTGSGASTSHTYTSAGTYSPKVVVYNAAGCGPSKIAALSVTAHPIPTASFTGTPTSFCDSTNAIAKFKSTSYGGTKPYSSLAWDFGDGSTGTGDSVNHQYTKGGAFSVKLVVTDANGCTNTLTQIAYITVNTALPSFSGKTSICLSDLANFTNTTAGSSNTSWDFGDGYTVSNSSSATHFYSAAGTYTVKMTTTIGGCSKATSKTLTVNPEPSVTFSYLPAIPCPAPDTLTFTASSSITGSSFVWKDKNGLTLFSGNPYVRTYASNVHEEITVEATTGASCKGTFTDPNVMVRDIKLTVNPNSNDKPPFGLCINETTVFSTDLKTSFPAPGPNPYPDSVATWLWDFGDGSATSTNSNPSHSYTAKGDYNLKVIITTGNGCKDSTTMLVHADTKVKPSFYASPTAACLHTPITFYNTTRTSDTVFYTWQLQDTSFTTFDTIPAVTYGFPEVGSHDISLFTNHNGCIDFEKKQTYIDIHPPKAKFTYLIDCAPSLKVNFTNASIGASTQTWDFGDGSTLSTASSPSHTYAAPGKYYVKLIVHNNVYGCSDTLLDSITLITLPLDFTASKTKLCLGDTLSFSTDFMRAGATYFSWLVDTNAATVLSQDNYLVYQFASKGKHDIGLIALSGSNCRDTIWKRGYVNVSQPEVHFYANPNQGCLPFTASFVDTTKHVAGVSTATETWTFDGSSTLTGIHPTANFTYNYAGTYDLTLEVTDNQGCVNSLTRKQYIQVNDPKAMFSVAETLGCRGAPIHFSSTSIGDHLQHSWDFGDASAKGIGDNPVHHYADTGTFSVQLIVTDTIGCKDTFAKPNLLTITAPVARFSQSDSLAICPPLTIQFTNHSLRADSSTWDFDNGGGPVTLTNPVSTFITPQLYNIRLVVYDTNFCPDTARSVVRVLGYNGAFTYTPLKGCAPMAVTFAPPASGIAKITWDFNDGNTQITNGTGVTHVYTSPGVYLPNVVFSDGALCKASSIGVDSIYVDQVTADFSWSTPCVGSEFSLADHSSAVYQPAVSWLWKFGGKDTGIGVSPNYTYTTSGNHLVTLIATNAWGCSDTVSKEVFINPLPNIQTSPDKGLCPGDSTILTVTGGKSYTWSPAALVSCVTCPATMVYAKDSSVTYYVVGIDDNGCVNRDSVRVYFQFNTTVSTNPGGEICIGDTFRLGAQGADIYNWYPVESLDNPTIDSPLAKPTRSTRYLLVSKEGTCNVDSTYVPVTVHPLPIFSAGADQIMARGTSVQLQPTKNGIVSISWLKDSTLSCDDCFLPQASPRYTHTYYATGTDAHGCKSSDSVTVFVRCNGSLVFIPNTFSPNGDGYNDVFYPRGEGVDNMMSFRVFNRWGQVVFERNNVQLNDASAGWDGTFKGQKLQPDVYVYTMQSRCEDGEVVKWRGDITLLK
ncbi:MAG: PKD domain-containing protein [Bacteroidetes bacterium]|nr:PKD domain-containing protein [Bacteroidota bacterium]